MTQGRRGHLAMLAFSALVAGSFSLGSMMANELSPIAFNALRFVCAAVIVAVMTQVTVGIKRSDMNAPWRYLILGGLFATYFTLMFEGLKTAPPISAVAVFTLIPVMAAGFGWLLMRQITTPRIAAGLALGAAGALWVVFRADLSAILAFEVGRGEAIFFCGCIAHAIYTPMVPRLNRGEAPIVFTLGTIVVGGIVLTILGWGEIRSTNWAELPAIVWITLAYTAVFATTLSFLALQFASLHLPASKVMAYTYLTPSWVIGSEYLLGHGFPAPLVLVGVAMTVCAMLLLIKEEPEAAGLPPV